MELGFDFEQQGAREVARSLLKRHWSKSSVREMEKESVGYSIDLWQQMAELGWMGLMFPEKYGGNDSNFITMALIVEEMGRALLPGPFIGTVVCGGLAVLHYGSEKQKDVLLPQISSGKLILAPAFSDHEQSILKLPDTEKVASRKGGYAFTGTRLFAPYAHMADHLICNVMLPDGCTLFLIDAKQSNVKITVLPSIGPDKQCEVVFDQVRLSDDYIIGQKGNGQRILTSIHGWASVAYTAFILGALGQVLEMTVSYAKQRVQFGKHIGSFQSIQHQCADMLLDIDATRLLTYQAAWRLSQQIPAAKEISLAKARASDASKRVSLLGVKIHGGVGLMEEHDMSIYFRMAKSAETAFGDADYHRAIVAKQLGL